jgi:hypothetical protein
LGIVADDTYVYVAENIDFIPDETPIYGTICRITRSNGAVVRYSDNALVTRGGPFGLALFNSRLYFTDNSGHVGYITTSGGAGVVYDVTYLYSYFCQVVGTNMAFVSKGSAAFSQLPLPVEPPVTNYYNVRVKVVDRYGTPLKDAKVTLNGYTSWSNKYGYAYFRVKEGTYTLRISKYHYYSSSSSLSVTKNTYITKTLYRYR